MEHEWRSDGRVSVESNGARVRSRWNLFLLVIDGDFHMFLWRCIWWDVVLGFIFGIGDGLRWC